MSQQFSTEIYFQIQFSTEICFQILVSIPRSVLMSFSLMKITYQLANALFHNLRNADHLLTAGTNVVYFDQRAHACACVRMVENNKNIRKL